MSFIVNDVNIYDEFLQGLNHSECDDVVINEIDRRTSQRTVSGRWEEKKNIKHLNWKKSDFVRLGGLFALAFNSLFFVEFMRFLIGKY
ncbi:CLUMA_CG001001, isoform A [Clunio marinus]|uniref:CLUMA_CG001001, isoform A n=1 Tax=Clunio marinus TaxID=568069 RepID=A0A1J1HIG7_9DIPT|nr:CLUMA_CG001001, isoform A [Clunio marinus]